MKAIGNFFRNLFRHPKTTAAGIAALASIGLAAAHNPAILAEPATLTGIFTGMGLLAASDPAAIVAAPAGGAN